MAAGDASLARWLFLSPLTAMLISFSLGFQHRAQRYKNFRNAGLSELASKISYVTSCFVGYWFMLGATGLIIAPAMAFG